MNRRLSVNCRNFIAGTVFAALAVLPCLLSAFPFINTSVPGENELKQGDVAASFGDIARAEKFYDKAMKLSSRELSLWSECVFRLGTIYLQRNDIVSAKNLLEKFREKIPAGSAGTLPGEIMAAENDFQGAEQYFNELIKRNDVYADKARFCLADIRMKQQKYQEAFDMYSSLRQSRAALVARKSEYAWVLAALKLGKFDEAKQMLSKAFAGSNDKNFRKLRLLCAVKEGDLEYFSKNWQLSDDDMRSDDFMCSLAELAAELAEKNGKKQYAAQLYENAFVFASEKDKKREIIGKLFSCCAAFDAAAASQVAERYAALFPDATDRALLFMQSGRLLTEKGDFKKAVEFYSKAANDRENLLVERNAALLEGATAAELGSLFEESEKFYQQMITLAPDANQKNNAKLKYAEFLLRRKMYAKAEGVLSALVDGDIHNSTGEKAAYRLLQSKSMQNTLSEKDLGLSAALEKSKKRSYAEFGSFTAAEIFRLTGRNDDVVRKKYLDFIAAYPESKFVEQAHFQAARIAGKKGNFESAAGEFVAFAEKFPKHQNAGAALFIAADCFCRADLDDKAEAVLKKLAHIKQFSDAFISGIMVYGEHLLHKNQSDKALKMLDELISKPDYGFLAKRSDITFLKARLLNKLKKYDDALAEFDKICQMPDNTSELAEAHYLAGNIRCDIFNNFSAAEKNFQKASELAKDSVFGHVCTGRLADCRYAIYLQTNDSKLLESAEELYRSIAEHSTLPDMRLQASYKAGLCREVAGDREKALEDYEQTLYLALTVRSFGVVPQQSWCERAAYAAIEIALSEDNSDDTDKAQQLLAVYRQLGYENSERDFQALRRKIRERQKLLNRGVRQ